MQAFTALTGRVLVLEQENIDTDQIIPGRFLTTTDFDGIGEHAFADWRFDPDGRLNEGHSGMPAEFGLPVAANCVQ